MFDDDFDIPDDIAAMADSAAAALAEMGEEYAKDASKDADQLLVFAERAKAAVDNEAVLVAMDDIFSIAHNFKGQGSTFGYELVTLLGDALCKISRPVNNPTLASVPQAVKISAAIHTILHQRITGDGGEAGAKLCAELDLAA
ncbi:hypothetical protein MNBD_ALPHA06-17 [hydrothermal vent metagenome]|uniref:HPt domain-containing protein n=1 Tax=hydrothermal vent metagenome TaxID=652676 RepID=A0A3B0R228_9ZZZZ